MAFVLHNPYTLLLVWGVLLASITVIVLQEYFFQSQIAQLGLGMAWVRRMIQAAAEPFATILALTAVLRLRIGETLGLRVSDVDFTKRIIRVRQSVDSASRTLGSVKSRASSADLPMSAELEARLRAHLSRRKGKSELLFVNRCARRLCARTNCRRSNCIRCWRNSELRRAGFTL